MREMILADDESRTAQTALAKILPMQRQDFVELFKIMHGLPVTIRLLDPPLHEFLPQHARGDGGGRRGGRRLRRRACRRARRSCTRSNPMLGHRGCRLGITYPEIYEMQARAIFEAAAAVQQGDRRDGRAGDHDPAGRHPEGAVAAEGGDRPRRRRGLRRRPASRSPYLVGTMIELPRAALLAGEIAKDAEFFSFGTNDLTQTTFGISRDDAARFLAAYRAPGHHRAGPLRQPRPRRRRRADPDRRRARPRPRARPQARHLRRARRRPGLDPLLRQGRPRLRLLLALPRADRPAGRRAGRAVAAPTVARARAEGSSSYCHPADDCRHRRRP